MATGRCVEVNDCGWELPALVLMGRTAWAGRAAECGVCCGVVCYNVYCRVVWQVQGRLEIVDVNTSCLVVSFLVGIQRQVGCDYLTPGNSQVASCCGQVRCTGWACQT